MTKNKSLFTILALTLTLFILLSLPTIINWAEIIYLDKFTKTTKLFVEDKTKLHITGEINSKSVQQIKNIFKKFPQINTIIIQNIPGSVNDEANLEISNWLLKKNLTTILLNNSHIASGGVDFFLIGNKRIIHKGAKVGIHSWGGPGISATNFPKNHTNHKPYINYYKNTGFSQKEAEEFYFFTIYSAPPSNIYYMNKNEIIKYKIATQYIE